ncbi:ankyrin repeat domain-containing protein [Marinobacterium sedimentorum]|uniref:ankyrin repeat domain-containing protein n=1 Tax=Marinobacterium sedimentorum TaxID=2927804 RepID=UPI0020C6FF13|nr:ankyrin repeat domain-containing protein [Marinobacterium sedimentorum]MCP8685947.1 ankyrin repeat domain-containing protein [Marinobacterium sedimentorum]
MTNPADDKPPKKTKLADYHIEKSDSLDEVHRKSLNFYFSNYVESHSEASKEKKREMIDRILYIVKRGRVDLFNIYLEHGLSINIQSDRTGFTILHMAAACGARDILRVLIKRDDCDYLLRDKKGRLASELAYLCGPTPDVAVSRLLGIKEKKQADKLGIKLTRRPL